MRLRATKRGQPVAPNENIASAEGDKNQRASLFKALQIKDRGIGLPQEGGEAFEEADVVGSLDDDQ